MWRSLRIRIAACLLLGAVTTVAVAWYFGWTVLLEDERLGRNGQPDLVGFTATEAPCWVVLASETTGARQWFVVPMADMDQYDFWAEGAAQTPGLTELPHWMGIDEPPPRMEEVRNVDKDFDMHVGHARGWPVPAMYSEIEFTWVWDYTEGPAVVHHGILVDQPDPRAHWLLCVLPSGIIWAGFAIDTVFYALIWLAAFTTLGFVRRSIRRRRGRCIACGYDLTGNTSGQCPECGAGLESSLTRSNRHGASEAS